MTSPNRSSEEVISTTAVTVIIGFGDIFDLIISKNVKERYFRLNYIQERQGTLISCINHKSRGPILDP